jgi:sRNA-binding protein
MAQLDLEKALRKVIARQVREALAPHLVMLEALAKLVRDHGQPDAAGSRPARRSSRGQQPPADSRNVVATAAPGKASRTRRSSASTSARANGDASPFTVGQEVQIRQGRGLLDATVMAIQADGSLLLEAGKERRQVVRQASKVLTAAAPAPARNVVAVPPIIRRSRVEGRESRVDG